MPPALTLVRTADFSRMERHRAAMHGLDCLDIDGAWALGRCDSGTLGLSSQYAGKRCQESTIVESRGRRRNL